MAVSWFVCTWRVVGTGVGVTKLGWLAYGGVGGDVSVCDCVCGPLIAVTVSIVVPIVAF